jgi:Malectin domain
MRARSLRVVAALAILAVSLSGCSGGFGPSAATEAPSYGSGGARAASGSAIVGPANTVSINAGGPQTGSFGADRYFSHGARHGDSQTIDMSQITDNPPPADIFNSERWGAMSYTIPDRSGPQSVTLYFSENYVSSEGQRIFDVEQTSEHSPGREAAPRNGRLGPRKGLGGICPKV